MKIILAVDGSKYSEWAADLLLKLPLTKDPHISVLHVVVERKHISPIIGSVLSKLHKDEIHEKMKKDLEAAEQLAAQIVAKLKVRWNNVIPAIEKGHVPERIIERARKEETDLIVLGSRGLGGIKNIILGSVSQKVVTYAPCSVLIVKRRINAFRKTLIAIDGSEYSDIAVSFLKSNFIPNSLDAIIVNVWDSPFMPPKLPADAIKKYTRSMFGGVFEAQALCIDGDPAEMIANTAHRKNVDLVIIGSKGLSGIKQFFLGSVARKLITCVNRSLLVVKT